MKKVEKSEAFKVKREAEQSRGGGGGGGEGYIMGCMSVGQP